MSYFPTNLMYMEYMHQLKAQATILDVLEWQGEKIAIILDQTIFYPQGGGQPYDIGSITSNNAYFNVEEVRINDGIVYHIGSLQQETLKVGDSVILEIDEKRRAYNSKNHTAGHIIDVGVSNLGLNLVPIAAIISLKERMWNM